MYFELSYAVTGGGVLIDSRLHAGVDLHAADVVLTGPNGQYIVLDPTSVPLPLLRVGHSFQIFVDGMVAVSDQERFAAAFSSVWKTALSGIFPFQGIHIKLYSYSVSLFLVHEYRRLSQFDCRKIKSLIVFVSRFPFI